MTLEKVRTWSLAALNFVYPLRCLSCENDVPFDARSKICGVCRASILPIPNPVCVTCGVPLPNGGGRCALCRKQKFHFAAMRSFGQFAGPLQNLIYKLKYGGKDELGNELSFFLMKAWERYPEIHDSDAAVPVPMHGSSLRERGYNQAEVLAFCFARNLGPARGLPFSKALARTRRTTSQTRLHSADRAKNVESAFAVKDPALVKGKTILLIDDVCTTGSTLQECAKALKKGGAKKVSALTLARNFV